MKSFYPAPTEVEQQLPSSVPSTVQGLAAAAVAAGSYEHAHLHPEHRSVPRPEGGARGVEDPPLVTYGDSLADPTGLLQDLATWDPSRPLDRRRWTTAEVEKMGFELRDETHRLALVPDDAEEADPELVASRRRSLRAARFEALRGLWDFSTLPGVRGCRRSVIDTVEGVQVRQSGDAVGLAGLRTCGSVWACPVCSARIQAERRAELVQLVRWASMQGYVVAFGTYTLRHKAGQPLEELLTALQAGYRSVGQARGPRRVRAELGYIGQVRAIEVTHGMNGWHPHIHTVLIFEGPQIGDMTQADADRLADAEFSVWEKQAAKHGLGQPLRERWQLTMVSPGEEEAVGEYLAKAVYRPPAKEKDAKAVGFEMQGSQTKNGRVKTSRTPWQILDSVMSTGDVDDLDLWQEYEQATKGRQSLVWSRGLKELAGIGEKTDEQVAAEEVGDESATLFVIPDWTPFQRDARLVGELLNAVDEGGKAAGLAWCAAHGIRTKEPPPGTGGGGDEDDD